MARPRWRRLGAFCAKLLVSLLIFVAGLELGTRLLSPSDRFEVLPNTFDPVTGVRQVPHGRGFVRCPEYEITITINGAGLRDDRDYPYARPPGRRRLLCLGDSFTFGLGVHVHETFAKVLEDLLADGTEVLNSGLVGTGTAEQLAWYETNGRLWQPDLVVLAFCVNDWTDNTKSGLFSLAADSTLVQHLAVEHGTLRRLRLLRRLPGYADWFARSHFVNRFREWFAVVHHGRLAAAAAGTRTPDEIWRHERALTEALLRRLREACRQDGAGLLVMPIPALPGSGEPEQRLEELMAFLRREGFASLDLHTAFAGDEAAGGISGTGGGSASLYYPVDGHWTAAGHALAARELAGWYSELSRSRPRR
ncbi:MAG: SGNH/GDSL hydrolase family protein [Candidatus Krumholzibacteria bacterium]|nr:SGNH/GDSL hydrolase family protein [Candidatus Krumholzibacteria bacterium]